MKSSVLDLESQVPEIIRALKKRKEVVVTYGNEKLAVIHALPEPPKKYRDLQNNPLFGIWRDRPEFADPVAYVRRIRKGRTHAL